MKIAVAADPAGCGLKQMVMDDLRTAGHEALDLGLHTPEQEDDYPDFAQLVCNAIRQGKSGRYPLSCPQGYPPEGNMYGDLCHW